MLTCVVNKNGKPLMPTYNIRKVRHMLKDGRAVIFRHDPFTIQLTYEIPDEHVQPVELTQDTGYLHIGVSVKSEKHEFFSEERTLLKNEKQQHQAQKKHRNNRRKRLRYRKPENKRARMSNGVKGTIAPSLRHKVDCHLGIIEKFMKVLPISKVVLEMGQFDTQVLTAVSSGSPVPQGLDYQHGPKYGYDTLREAVFSRDNHKCKCCGKSAIKDGVILEVHHIGYRKKDRSNRMGNLLTLCTGCHTPSNHQPGGKLWNIQPMSDAIPQAAFMNTVKWILLRGAKELLEDTHITYGAVTKRERRNRNIAKSHANDAYCIGEFHPKHRARTTYHQKIRRNDRELERFYDATYKDIRDGKTKKASELGTNRKKRCIPRNNPNNCRPFRGPKIKKGRRAIRKYRHTLRSGDICVYKGKKHEVKTCRWKSPKTKAMYETVEFTNNAKQIPVSKVKVIHRTGGWRKTDKES